MKLRTSQKSSFGEVIWDRLYKLIYVFMLTYTEKFSSIFFPFSFSTSVRGEVHLNIF